MRVRSLLIAFAILCFHADVFAQVKTPSFITDSLENYIRQGLKDWNIPGLAIAIVKDGVPVVMKGFGVKDVESKEPVDENTLFMIGSNTKLFTGTALAQLEYNNKLDLNDKVSKYINEFALYNNNSSDLVTVRDLLSHRIGTKTFQGDFTFYNGNLSRPAMISRMRLLKPSRIFRQDFGYCNSCYVTAGEVIPAITRQPWEVYIYDSILIPAGMTNTHTLSSGIGERENVAKPYTNQYTGQLTLLPYDHLDNIAAAGSIVSNVKDLSRWLILQLDSGKINGKQVIPWGIISATRKMNTILSSQRSANLPTHFLGYGLGIFMRDYNGRQVYDHTGGINGFVTNTCFVPEEKLGIAILTNNDNQEFFEALRYQVLDAYLGGSFTNRSKEAFTGFTKEMAATVSRTKKLKERVKGAAPSLSLENYAGTYTNELYGPIIIEKDNAGKKLVITFKGHNRLKADVEYLDNNEWLLTYNNLAYGIFPVTFKIENKKVNSIEIKFNDFIEFDPYTFIKE